MNFKRKQKRNLAVFPVIAIISLSMLAGCELLVDFDRTLIDGGTIGDVDATFDGNEPFDSASDAPATADAGDATITDAASSDAGDSAIDDASDASDDADADM